MILHDAGYTKGISYSSAPFLHKETKDKKTRNIVNKSDLSMITGQSTHKIEPGNAFKMKGALTKMDTQVRRCNGW